MLRSAPILFLSLLISLPVWASGDIERGKYILDLGGCASCHQTPKKEEAELAGGHALKTPFGVFYVPNITPDKETGIGGWSDDEFINAMQDGVSPNGSHYFPAFPYTSYAKIKRQDLLDLKAYLDSLTPVSNQVREHDLQFPFNQRFLMFGWKTLFFDDKPFVENSDKSDQWNRGAYIVNALAHCGECHSPRNMFGGVDQDKKFQGNPDGADKEKIPSMLPKWNKMQLFAALRMGMTPEGDFLGGSMGHVVANTTSKMTKQDLQAVVTYISELK